MYVGLVRSREEGVHHWHQLIPEEAPRVILLLLDIDQDHPQHQGER